MAAFSSLEIHFKEHGKHGMRMAMVMNDDDDDDDDDDEDDVGDDDDIVSA